LVCFGVNEYENLAVGMLQLYSAVKCELETLKQKENELIEELNTYKDKVTDLCSVCHGHYDDPIITYTRTR